MISAKEAAEWGLVSRVYPAEEVLEKAIDLGERIAKFSLVALRNAKEAVNAGKLF